MIKPLNESDEASRNFVVLDIENYPDGSIITIDVAWREGEKIVHETFTDWAAFWDWIVPKAKADDRFRVLYAHNGGGWDWLSLAHYLLTDGAKKRMALTAALAASKCVTMTVVIEKQVSIHFCDSLQLLRSSLDKLGETFVGRKKVDLGGKLPHEIYQADPVTFFQYVREDTELLLLVLEKALELIREKVAKIEGFGFTVGSTALKVFRTIGLKQPIAIPFDENVKEFLREGYRGGRVEVFRCGYYPTIRVYDINSLYPYAMLTADVPVSDRGKWVDTFQPDFVGVYRVRFRQINRDIPPVLMIGGEGRYEGEGVFYDPELRLLWEVDPKAIVEIQTGYIFLDSDKVFQDFVNRLYAVRLSDPDGPASLLAKYLLNSLYGKFGQHSEREKIICVDDIETAFDMVESESAKIRILCEDRNVFGLLQKTHVGFEHVGIAGMITSVARVALYRGILSAGVEKVVYCDTDSVHTTGVLHRSMVGKAIGQFKLEFTGEGVYAGKKLYALRDRKTGKEKVRCKGVSVGGRNGSKLNFDDMVRVSQGEAIKLEFSQPATALQVFVGKQPCVFGPRKRTIRRIIK